MAHVAAGRIETAQASLLIICNPSKLALRPPARAAGEGVRSSATAALVETEGRTTTDNSERSGP